MQRKADSDKDGDSEMVIGKGTGENRKIVCIFCDGSAKSSALDEKPRVQCTWHNVQMSPRTHVECSDAETDKYVWEYRK